MCFYSVPLTVGLSAHSPAEVTEEQARELGIAHKRENISTLTIGASQIDDLTFVSTPERAVLETAEGDVTCGFGALAEALVNSLVYETVSISPETMLSLADDLGFHKGLRRLASLCRVIEDDEGLPDTMLPLLESLPSAPPETDWAEFPLRDPSLPSRESVFWDRRNRVAWHVPPADFMEGTRT